jgi:hypothetical protein
VFSTHSLKFTEKGDKNYRLQKFSTCTDSTKNLLTLSGPVQSKGFLNKLVVNGNFEVLEDVSGPIFYTLSAQRCQLNSQNCGDPYPPLYTDKLCEKIVDTTEFWASFVAGIVPPISCPIKKVCEIQKKKKKLLDWFEFLFLIPRVCTA